MRFLHWLIAAGLALAPLPALAVEAYQLDPAHSDVVFKVSHLGFSKTIGRFDRVTGVIELDEAEPERSRVTVTIDAASIDTNDERRDQHLRGPEFFDVADHPTIGFESHRVERIGDATARVHGELTMLGVRRPLVLLMVLNQRADHPLRPGTVAVGFSGRATLKRSDFGMTFGLPAVGDEVEVMIEVEGLRR